MTEKKRPEWVPDGGGKGFTTTVMKGVKRQHDGFDNNLNGIRKSQKISQRKKLDVNDYVRGILDSDRTLLARAITLIESNSSSHLKMGQSVLKEILPKTGKSIRIGITGVPGAGKSTFIEALGIDLIKAGHKLAVLAVDPSSSLTKGSVLGDKTRMENLSREENCFIRPSPSGGTLGGVARKTRETILLCEAAGYDVILIETVGVGQNEITVRSMVDFFLLLKIAGAGDELQGIKKGVIELADGILINKADRDNRARAEIAKQDFKRALHYLNSPTEGWIPEVKTISSIEVEGITDVWKMILAFKNKTSAAGIFQIKRKSQLLDWMDDLIKEHLQYLFYQNDRIMLKLPHFREAIIEGTKTPTSAATELLEIFEGIYSSK